MRRKLKYILEIIYKLNLLKKYKKKWIFNLKSLIESKTLEVCSNLQMEDICIKCVNYVIILSYMYHQRSREISQ